ncbi:MAG: phage integrase SAM-like domain and Arm DNA-binding domain-containing protein [Cyclobacteriaceae bacterium]
MKVTLRQRNQGGKTSLYLDYYHKGSRKLEYLKLYLDPKAKTKEAKELNKKTLQSAETIKAQRQIEIQNGFYGFRNSEKLKGDFLAYVRTLAEKRRASEGNYGNWNSMIKHLEEFSSSHLTFEKIDSQFVENFKSYLDKDAKKKNNKGLSQNSKYSYFNKSKAAPLYPMVL